jgi:serine/threonine protein phosphatase PrpC
MEHYLVHSIGEFSSNEPSEDRYFVRTDSDISLYCVIDGHGGCFACDLAQQYLVDILMSELIKAIKLAKTPPEILQLFESTFKKCDDAILQEAVSVQSDQNRLSMYY